MLSYLVLSYPSLSYVILSYLMLYYLILYYLILSYLILSYLILSYLILSIYLLTCCPSPIITSLVDPKVKWTRPALLDELLRSAFSISKDLRKLVEIARSDGEVGPTADAWSSYTKKLKSVNSLTLVSEAPGASKVSRNRSREAPRGFVQLAKVAFKSQVAPKVLFGRFKWLRRHR